MTTPPSTTPTPAPTGKAAARRSGASAGTVSSYNRMVGTFGTTAGPQSDWRRQPDGNWWHWEGAQWVHRPEGPPNQVATGVDIARFTTDGALNKTGLLGLVALTVGAVAYVADVPVGAVVVGALVALAVGIWCSFSPRRAPVLAPIFAALEGGVLGALSRYYANQGQHVVILAVVGTVAIVAAVWAVYRTGLVRVGHRFFQISLAASVGLLAVIILAILTGWGVSGLGGFVIFGVLYLVVAVMNLFVDFSFVSRAEQMGLPAEAEWYSAFSILVASCMVYLALLRMLGGRR
jgi:uncharacterized YccA/Bax inhibitor family protein